MKKIATKKKIGRKLKPREKIDMLKCWVVSIKEDYLIMRPIKDGLLGTEDTVTHTVKKSQIEGLIKIKDEVVALNVHEVSGGWRAKKILISMNK